MKLAGTISTIVLSLSLGVGIPAYAQQEQHDQQENKDKPAAEKEKAQPEKAATKEVKEAPAKPAQENHTQVKETAKQTEVKEGKEDRKPEEKTAQEHAQPKPEQRGTARIPDDRFRANFGQDHRFRVNESDYRRDRRFQYGGYWFSFAQPWPANWLYTQEVYVIEIDGVYYLCNESFPGVNVTLNVTL